MYTIILVYISDKTEIYMLNLRLNDVTIFKYPLSLIMLRELIISIAFR